VGVGVREQTGELQFTHIEVPRLLELAGVRDNQSKDSFGVSLLDLSGLEVVHVDVDAI